MSSEESYGARNTERYFFDTYALVEISKGNPAYRPYEVAEFNLTTLNLFEFHQFLLREKSELAADRVVERLVKNVVDFDVHILKIASKFRHKNKQKNMSMSDCVGYICAKERGLIFLTGDKAFEGLGSVRFVK